MKAETTAELESVSEYIPTHDSTASIGIKYRPEVDGLRAVAVLAVLLYHAGLVFPGGYIGVDVFFVISGFLIFSLIWNDLGSGRFTLAGFWERRARRIIPAVFVLSMAVLIAGWFALFPQDYRSLGKATTSQSVFAANIFYWKDTGYFAGVAAEKPLLHTWSLAVEEQFYLFMPFLALVAYRASKTTNKVGAKILFPLLFLISLTANIIAIQLYPSATFYLLPTRAWELLLGALVALFPSTRLFRLRVMREIASIAGISLIVVAGIAFNDSTKFPGIAALLPCTGAALFIWATTKADTARNLTLAGRLLASRPVVFIGKISYSLYLWHWPILVFLSYVMIDAPSPVLRVVALLLAFALAAASWKFVEKPFRDKRIATGRSIFAYSAVGSLLMFGCGATVYSLGGIPERFPKTVIGYTNARDETRYPADFGLDDALAGRLTPLGNEMVHPTWLVWGDSHAKAAILAFDQMLKEHAMSGIGAAHSSTPPLLSWHYSGDSYGLNELAPAFGKAVLDTASARQIKNVVLVGYWKAYVSYAKGKSTYNQFEKSLVDTVKDIKARGMVPWVLLDVPIPGIDVPRVLSRAYLQKKDISPMLQKASEKDDFDGIDEVTINALRACGARIVNPKSAFLDPSGMTYLIEKNGAALYFDGQHLTTTGALTVLKPYLEVAMQIDEKR
jgi:peptidoglycan/LPS O-acetylase OafA/YrhL